MISSAVKSRKRITREGIKDLTANLWREHFDEMGWTKPDQIRMDIRELYETTLYPKYEYELITSVDLGYVGDSKVLGKVVMEDKVVLASHRYYRNHQPALSLSCCPESGSIRGIGRKRRNSSTDIV